MRFTWVGLLIQLRELSAVVLDAHLFGKYLISSCRLLVLRNSNVHGFSKVILVFAACGAGGMDTCLPMSVF